MIIPSYPEIDILHSTYFEYLLKFYADSFFGEYFLIGFSIFSTGMNVV